MLEAEALLFELLCVTRFRAQHTSSDDALALIVRSSEGVLRRLKNLCLAALLAHAPRGQMRRSDRTFVSRRAQRQTANAVASLILRLQLTPHLAIDLGEQRRCNGQAPI